MHSPHTSSHSPRTPPESAGFFTRISAGEVSDCITPAEVRRERIFKALEPLGLQKHVVWVVQVVEFLLQEVPADHTHTVRLMRTGIAEALSNISGRVVSVDDASVDAVLSSSYPVND